MPSLGAPQDYIALGLANGLVLFKFDLGSKTEEVASSDKVKMDQPNVVTITRDRKNGNCHFSIFCFDFQCILIGQ